MLKKLFTIRNLAILLATVALFVVSGLLGLKVSRPEISIVAEPVFHIGTFAITNSLFMTWVVMALLILISFLATRRIPKDLTSVSSQDLVPGSLQNAVELFIESFHNLVEDIAGDWTPRFFPIVMTIFLLVIFSNVIEVLPGSYSIGLLEHPHAAGVTGFVARGAILTAEPAQNANTGYILVPLIRPPSTDLNFTVALALIAVGLTQYFGIRAHKLRYFQRFVNFSGFKEGIFSGVMSLVIGLLESISELAKIISFSFRLFGNIFAGDVLLAVIAFLIPYIASLPFYGLELFVDFIQAVIFMMLALVFFSIAVSGHGSSEES